MRAAAAARIARWFKRAGATGLEPATSGVTDHYSARDVNDDAHASALFMRFFGGLRVDSARLREAARDVCCPSAACSTLSEGIGRRRVTTFGLARIGVPSEFP